MDLVVTSELLPWLAGVMGLLVGSFLNVVIYRLPRMMESQWAKECAEFSGQAAEGDAMAQVPLSLSRPRSHCPHCAHPIAWHENIPVLSYLRLAVFLSTCVTR